MKTEATEVELVVQRSRPAVRMRDTENEVTVKRNKRNTNEKVVIAVAIKIIRRVITVAGSGSAKENFCEDQKNGNKCSPKVLRRKKKIKIKKQRFHFHLTVREKLEKENFPQRPKMRPVSIFIVGIRTTKGRTILTIVIENIHIWLILLLSCW